VYWASIGEIEEEQRERTSCERSGNRSIGRKSERKTLASDWSRRRKEPSVDWIRE